MKNNFRIYVITAVFALGLSTQVFSQPEVVIPTLTQQIAQSYAIAYPLDMVRTPSRYLNKLVTVRAKFDKFSTLGLDYSPAKRSSDDYISFLIQRDDVSDHSIPLSEMKIFMKRTEAEKYIDLNSGDEVEFSGRVFSNALGDVWMDAEKFKVISKKEQPKK